MQFTKANILLLSVFLFTSFAYGTVVQTCSKGIVPHFVNISNCEREPCIIPNGKDIVMLVAFTVPKYSAIIKPKATAIIPPGLPIVYPLPDDGSIVNGYLPIYEGEVLLYKNAMPIENYPAISFTLQFELLSDARETMTCFRVKCSVVNE